jgi:hypothetical protein
VLTNPPRINCLLSDEIRIVIDGLMQHHVTRLDVRSSLQGGTRIYLRWCVPEDRLEWDGRDSAYYGRTCSVTVGTGSFVVANGNARVAHFAVGQTDQAHVVLARAILMIDGPLVESPPPAPKPVRNPFGYEGKS